MGDDLFGISGTLQAGHFQIERAVAEGGFAVVYRARHTAFRAPVALKCLKVPGSITDEQRDTFLEKFRAEAELLFRLSGVSASVVRPLQVGSLDLPGKFVPFLALEWLDGESLEAVRARREEQGKPPLGLQKVVRLLAPAAKALWTAHRLPGPDGPVAVIHCDMKPENIYLVSASGSDTIKILDFGIARVKSVTQAIAGRTSGKGSDQAFTPGYGAPEQWDPERFGGTGPWTDVFSFALTMVELLHGKPVIEGALGTMMAMTCDQRKRPTPRSLGIAVPDVIEEAMAAALAVDPKERTQDIFSFWSEIERALGLPPSLTDLELEYEPVWSKPPPADRLAGKEAGAGMMRPIPRPSPTPEIPLSEAPLHSVRDSARASIRDSSRGSMPSVPDLGRSSAPPKVLPPMQDWSSQRFAEFSIRQDDMAPLSAPLSAPVPISMEVRTRPPVRRQSYSSQPMLPEMAAPSTTRTMLEILSTPLKLASLAVGLALVDQALLRLAGEAFALGPVRFYWVAVVLAVVAVAMAFNRLFSAE